MQQHIKSSINVNAIPLMKKGKANSYRPDDIKKWGIQRFLETVCSKEPIIVPDFNFSKEENKKMEEIILEEKLSNDL